MTDMVTIPRALLQDLVDDVSDYAASREFKPREKAWRDDVLVRACALLATPLPEPSAEVTDTVRVPARVLDLLNIINRDGVIKRAAELQEVYRLTGAVRVGEAS